MTRAKNIFRRAGYVAPDAPAPSAKRCGDIELNCDRHEAWRGRTRLYLTPMEFRIVAVFTAHPGQIFTRARLLLFANDEQFNVFDRTLDRHIANLRRKVEIDPKNPRHIVTVLGVGYKFVCA